MIWSFTYKFIIFPIDINLVVSSTSSILGFILPPGWLCTNITDAALAQKRVDVLMGDKVEPRKEWIDENVEFTLEDDYRGGVN